MRRRHLRRHRRCRHRFRLRARRSQRRFPCVADAVRKFKNSQCAAVSAAMSTANDGSAVRFGRWWWCWRRRRRSTTIRGPTMPTTYHPRTIILLSVLALISVLLSHVDAAARTKADESRGSTGRQKEAEPVIEEVTAKQLERLLNEKDFVAVYWCKCSISRVTIFQFFDLVTNYSVIFKW